MDKKLSLSDVKLLLDLDLSLETSSSSRNIKENQTISTHAMDMSIIRTPLVFSGNQLEECSHTKPTEDKQLLTD